MAEVDLARLRGNIRRMIDAGAPEAEIDQYVALEGTTPDALRAQPEAPQYSAANPASPALQPAPPDANGRQWFEGAAPPPTVPAPREPSPVADLQASVQGAGRGILQFAGAVPELATAATNLGIGGINLGLAGADKVSRAVGGPEIPGRINFQFGSPTEALSNTATSLATSAGIPVMNPDEMTPRQKLNYNVNRFGTEAAGLSGTLARLAAKPISALGARPAPSMIDPLTQPYAGGASGRTLTGDAGGAIGSGAAVTAVEESRYKDSPIANTLASLAGGIGGSMAATAARSPVDAGRRVQSFLPDPNIPRDPETGAAASRSVSDHTARYIQGKATDPAQAATRFEERVNTARAAGAPAPTAGIGSDDIGMIAMERGARAKNSVPFSEHDQKVLDRVQNDVTSLHDPAADQGAVTRFAKDRPDELAKIRDDDALPFLRTAEASGAKVDAQPVADLIDSKLKDAKRPPVVSALKQARGMLNRVGTEDLDTSVSGLYEARKAINDIIEGRTENPTGRWAKRELIEVRTALDDAIGSVAPEFKTYLTKYKDGSAPLNAFEDNKVLTQLSENNDPRNVARRLLSGEEYGAEKTFATIKKEIDASGKPEIDRAWKSAVVDVLVDKVTTTNTALTGGAREGPVSVAQLQKVFKTHEKALAEVVGPTGMSTLRTAHKMLEPFGNLSRRAVTGSQTAETNQLINGIEAGILAYTGNAIHTGMIMRRLKVAASLVPGVKDLTLEAKMMKLRDRMWFDPELFTHLMTKPLRNDPPEWNAKLNRLLAYDEGARDFNE